MAAFLLKLLALLAVALMPIGMGTAGAQPASHHASAASHCAGEEEQQAPVAPEESQCMACAGLPAAAAPAAAERLVPAMPRLLRLSHEFAGIEPEITTPPPKRA